MSIRKIINWEGSKAESDLIGTIASPWYQLYDDHANWVWACDVDIGETEVLREVPLAVNNRDVLYADIGKPVALKKMGRSRYAIVGLAKKIQSTTHILYVKFEEEGGGQGDFGVIVNEETQGYVTRLLTYPELALYGGYGTVPYGAAGRFDAQGNLVELIY